MVDVYLLALFFPRQILLITKEKGPPACKEIRVPFHCQQTLANLDASLFLKLCPDDKEGFGQEFL